MDVSQIFKLIVAIIVCEFAGIIGSIFTVSAIPTWYATITRPEFSPPNWIFGPVWTTLYAFMGIAVFLVWQKGIKKKNVQIAVSIFAIQLCLNTLWSIIFFGLQNPGAALIEISMLWITIFATMIAFAKISKASVWLLAPYILWVSFAAYLNYSIWILN